MIWTRKMHLLCLSLGVFVHLKNQTASQNAIAKCMEMQSDGATGRDFSKHNPAVLETQLRSRVWSDRPKLELKSTWDKVIEGQVSPGNSHLPASHVRSKPTSSQQLGRRANPPVSGMYQLLITRD